MGKGGRKTERPALRVKIPQTPGVNSSPPAWNLKKKDLGAVIFVCSNDTFEECHSKLLFGLPPIHIPYVKNINPGLPLFLFNYSDRKLHGIYEAVSHGRMNMDQFAWTGNSSDSTQYPAQVRVCVWKRCQPLSEKNFSKVIQKNYVDLEDRKAFFRLELDKIQTRALISLFEQSPVTRSLPTSSKKAPQCRPLPQVNPKIDVFATRESSSEHLNNEPRNPSELPRATGSWASLFKSMSDPVPKSEVGDKKPLDSEAGWDEDDPLCLDLSNIDSGPSGWDEEKQILGSGPSGWDEEQQFSDSGPSGWDEEKHISEINSNEAKVEDEETIYTELKQLSSARENSNLKNTDTMVPCKEDKLLLNDEEEHSYSDLLQSTFDHVYSNLEEPTEDDPLGMDNTIIIDQLRKEVEEWKAISMEQYQKTNALEKKLKILETYLMEQHRRTSTLEKKLEAIERAQATLAKRMPEPARSELELTEPEDVEDW